MVHRIKAPPRFGGAPKRAGVAKLPATMRSLDKGAAVSRRNETTYTSSSNDWRRSAAATLSTTDTRWAPVCTSVTGLIAGTGAWLAMGTALPTTSQNAHASRSLIPYELFQRLA